MFPYKRSLGPVIGAFLTALSEQRIIGIRSGERVLCPPLEWDPDTAAELAHDFVEVGPAGTVESWTWVSKPSVQHPLDHPFAFATIRLDGADNSLIHVIDAESADALSTGMRVAPRWRAERKGHITDIEAFVPGEEAVLAPAGEAGEPITMMDYDASITYRTPIPANVIRSEVATGEGRFLGLKCPTCGRTYTGGKGYCPIDSVALTEADEVDLTQVGVITNYTIITPIQYPGQTETEPFARVHVLLDGDDDVVMPYQALIEVAAEDVHIGLRVAAVWASEAEKASSDEGNLIGWMPTGEPDNTDPTLVNRIN
ncbi:OB-fold nucleic acid binding domain-containing protein [soil metagenome]